MIDYAAIRRLRVRKTDQVHRDHERLLNEFRNGRKQPISALNEYCQIRKLDLRFLEEPVLSENLIFGSFAFAAYIDKVRFPQGVSRTKKEAKTVAARTAFYLILDETPPDDPKSTYQPPRATQFSVAPTPPLSVPRQLANWFQDDDEVSAMSSANTAQEVENEFYGLTLQSGDTPAVQDNDSPLTGEVTDTSVVEDNPLPDDNRNTDVDKIQNIVFEKFQIVLSQEAEEMIPHISKILAAFVLQSSADISESQVVSIGTGAGSLAEPSSAPGLHLHDCHGLVIAKRGLHAYLYNQVRSYAQNQRSIFQSSNEGRLKLKEGYQLHLYMMQPPCGDALNSTLHIEDPPLTSKDFELMDNGLHCHLIEADSNQGKLFLKTEGFGTQCKAQTLQSSFSIMSCSDKLLKWNVLGVQGSLLAQFIEPIYIESFNFGAHYHHGHITRAICCRAGEEIRELPSTFKVNHAWIGRVTNPVNIPTEDSKKLLSLCWFSATKRTQLLDPHTGLIDRRSAAYEERRRGASIISKRGFFNYYSSLFTMFGWGDVPSHYSEAKLRVNNSAQYYLSAREGFRRRLVQKGMGSWCNADYKFDHIYNQIRS